MPNFIPKFRHRIRHRKSSRFPDFFTQPISNLLAIDANRLLIDFLSLTNNLGIDLEMGLKHAS